jgi:hypothetical protein
MFHVKPHEVVKFVSLTEKVMTNFCETGVFSWIFETLLIILRLALLAKNILVSTVQLLIVITVPYQHQRKAPKRRLWHHELILLQRPCSPITLQLKLQNEAEMQNKMNKNFIFSNVH